MQRGIVFSIEATYLLIMVIALTAFTFSLMQQETYSTESVELTKLAHDLGELNSTSEPVGYGTGNDCNDLTSAKIPSYYYVSGKVCFYE